MKLSELIKGIEGVRAAKGADSEVRAIKIDSRKVTAGDMFAALHGHKADGISYAPDAIKRGASAVLAPVGADVSGINVPVVYAGDARAAVALLSARLCGTPSRALTLIGVTGTNGKTTTTHIIKSILSRGGARVGVIGTIGYSTGGDTLPAPFTTPEAPEYQWLLAGMRDAGCKYAVSEVSSHALAERRVDGSVFKGAVFTNLTRDHLDYHGTMEEYYGAKRRLFAELLDGPAAINADDPWGARLMAEYGGVRLSYGQSPEAAVRAEGVELRPEGLSFTLAYPGGRARLASALIGMPNVYNILSASTICIALGITPEQVADGVAAMSTVAGRFMKVEAGQGFLCVVDYAHTDDALDRLLRTVRPFTRGRVITVFGCGGDRDRGKRPMMGAVATSLSDRVIITSDNPRSEDPEAIIREVAAGAKADNWESVAGRAEAIARAIGMATDGDTVVIAGKGHEDYQETGGVRVHFSDAEAAAHAIVAAGKGRQA